MPILRTDFNENLTTFVATGQVTFEEAMDTIQTFYAGNPSLYVIWDFRHGTISRLPYEKIELIIKYLIQVAHKRAEGKTAMVTVTPVDYGVARIFEALIASNNLPFYLRVFVDYDEAMAWLKGDSQW